MARFTDNGKIVKIDDFTIQELQAITKLNVPCIIAFSDGDKLDSKIVDYLILEQRTNIGKKNAIKVKSLTDKAGQLISYPELYTLIQAKSKLNIPSVQVRKNTFDRKEPLFLMINRLNLNLVNSCIYIDYDSKNQIYILVSKEIEGELLDKLFYFEENDSILTFTEKGPNLVIGKTSSIEDILCQ